MSKVSKIRKSRDTWKTKAVERGSELRYYRRELGRVKKERDRFRKESKEAHKEVDTLKRENQQPAVCNKEQVIFMAVMLFQKGHIGFRAVSRVLEVLGKYLGISKAPCVQTVINWVNKLTVARMEAPAISASPATRSNTCNGSMWVIDTSIALGAEKLLCLLALDAHHHGFRKGYPTLEDVRCIAVATAASWTGQSIADFLWKAIQSLGRPVAFLKDGGTDLIKAMDILKQQGCPIPCIEDVSHFVANLLKHEYGGDPLLERFLSACGKASQKLKQTVLACLAPPRTPSKARFMNLHRLVSWADQILRHSPAGRAPKGSLLEKLRKALGEVKSCRPFIRRFLRDAEALLACEKVLKTEGLTEKTIERCCSILQSLPQNSPVCKGFVAWMSRQSQVAQELGLIRPGLVTSSDCIESVFQLGKSLGAGEIKDAHRIGCHIPAMCGTVTPDEIPRIMQVSGAHTAEVLGKQASLMGLRRRILPNPGTLEELLATRSDGNIELIAGAEKCARYSGYDVILMG
mgnify:CR=1 FL=1